MTVSLPDQPADGQLSSAQIKQYYFGFSARFGEKASSISSRQSIYETLKNELLASSDFANVDLNQRLMLLNILETVYRIEAARAKEEINEDLLIKVMSAPENSKDLTVGEGCAVAALSTVIISSNLIDELFLPIDLLSHCSGHHSDLAGEVILGILAVLMVILVLILAFYSAYTAFESIAANIERLWFKEGFIQPLFNLLVMGTAGAAAGYGAFFLVVSLVGLTPIIWPVLAGVTGAAIGLGMGVLANFLLNCLLPSSTNRLSFSKTNQAYFELTDSEARRLYAQGIDPIKVKCLFAQLSKEVHENNLASVFSRDAHQDEILDIVRSLRGGTYVGTKVKIKINVSEDVTLDLRLEDQHKRIIYFKDNSLFSFWKKTDSNSGSVQIPVQVPAKGNFSVNDGWAPIPTK